MKARTVALRDQLVAVLRDAEVPIATSALAAHSGLPWHEVGWWFPCSRVVGKYGACVGGEINGLPIVGCTGEHRTTMGATKHIVRMPPDPGRVYAHLRALERRGLVARVHLPDMRAVYWAYVHNDSDDAMNKLLDGLSDVQSQ